MLDLNVLVDSYKASGFDVLGVPANQFGLQMPGANNEVINQFTHVRPGEGYVPNFNISVISRVNRNPTEDPLYAFLKNNCEGTTDSIGAKSGLYWSQIQRDDITWNFEKFLVDKTGKPIRRYHPSVEPETLVDDIEELLGVPAAKRTKRSSSFRGKLFDHEIPRRH